MVFFLTQGYHRTFAKITENLRVRAVSQKMNTKRDRKVRKRKTKQEKTENGKNGKSASLLTVVNVFVLVEERIALPLQ